MRSTTSELLQRRQLADELDVDLGDLPQQRHQFAHPRQRRGHLVHLREIGGGPHLVEHVVEVVGEVLDVLAIERGDDRRLETAANLTHHLVAGTLGGHDAVDPVVENRQRLHQLLELEGGAGRVRGLLLEERVEPLVTGNQTKAHGGLPGRSCDASAG